MKDMLVDIAKAIVDHPDEVVVEVRDDGEMTHLELSVAPSDMGKVIGKQGKIAKAIRTLIKAASAKDTDKKYVVDIIDK
ncbi:MAG: KH domain-containing protein [Ruminococcaceae bacterium]|nr:KH domain-containing protein [Oscillospiraceae bacterium]